MEARTLIGLAIIGGGGFLAYRLLTSKASATDNLQLPLDLMRAAGDPVAPVSIPNATVDKATGLILSNDPLDKLNIASTPELASAIRFTETGSNPAQTSAKGAVGAMQLLPNTAKSVAASIGLPYDANRLLNDVNYNVQLGTAYLNQLLARFGGNRVAAVTAYFAGPDNVANWINRYGTPGVSLSGAYWLMQIGASGNPLSASYAYTVANHL